MAVNPNSFIIGITGGKGGMGKSVFSANLALAFALELKQPTLLIDLDSQSCGDQNFILGVREVKTVSELGAFNGGISAQTASNVVTMMPGTSMGYIAAVRGRDETLGGNVDQIMRQLENLTNVFRFVIIDLGNQIGPMQLAAIERSTALLLVTAPEVLAVNQTMRMMTELLASNLPTEVVQIIVNKAGPAGLAPAAIGQTLRKPVLGIIPQDDATVLGSVARSAPFVISAPKSAVATAHFDVVRRLTGGVLQQLKAAAKPQKLMAKDGPKADVASSSPMRKALRNLDPRTALKITVHNELIKAMDLKKGVTDTQGDPEKEADLKKKTNAVIATLIDKEGPGLGREERGMIIKEVLDEALGLGPLEDLLEDPSVSEIMVCGHEKIYIEKNGIVQLSPTKFTSNFHLRKVIERIVAPLGRQINESIPYVDARLKDGSRVNAIVEPLAIDGPAVTIRKFRKGTISPETYYKEWNASTAAMMEFLRICVANKMNIVISGGTGSGKTTLLNTISAFIPSNERIVTIEDAAELQMKQDHVVRLETRPANMEGTGAVTIRDLVKNALRMRPERIVVGECRDGAALDMLGAMSTGHDGSMTTVHANNPKEAIGRIESLCMMAGSGMPVTAIREQIANAVNLIVQIQRLSDGSRKLISISEVQGMQGEVVTQQEVFRFVEKGFDKNRKIVGEFQATGLVPKCIEKFEKRGLIIPKSLFSNAPIAPTLAAAPPASARPAATPVADPKKASGGTR